MTDIECFRCGAENEGFTLPSHPDGGGDICHVCWKRIYDNFHEPWTWTERNGSTLPRLLDARSVEVCHFGSDNDYYNSCGSEPYGPDRDRIVACVNGCAGIADPSAIPKLVAEVTEFMVAMSLITPNAWPDSRAKVTSLLAQLKGK